MRKRRKSSTNTLSTASSPKLIAAALTTGSLLGVGSPINAEEVVREEVGAREQTAPPLVYRNETAQTLAKIFLRSRGEAGQTGSVGFLGIGSQRKEGPGSGGDVTFENNEALTLAGTPGSVVLLSTGPDSIRGSGANKYSAQPGRSGKIRFVNKSQIVSDQAEGDEFLVDLKTLAGNWSVSNETGGYTKLDIDDVPQYLKGLDGVAIDVDLSGGSINSARSVISALSQGGMGAGPTEDQIKSAGGFFAVYVSRTARIPVTLLTHNAGAGGQVDISLSNASVTSAGVAIRATSQGAKPVVQSNYDLRPGGDGGSVIAALEGAQIRTTGANAYGLQLSSQGGSVAGNGGADDLYTKLPEQAGRGGNGGLIDVKVDVASKINTVGDNAHGVFAQSSGGGGAAGFSEKGLFFASGSVGGAAGNGGQVRIEHLGEISTKADDAYGILAGGVGGGTLQGSQSLAGGSAPDLKDQEGGGDGGGAYSIGLFASAAIGGGGGGGGDGPDVTIRQAGKITTLGQHANGIGVITVGGNGGKGGGAVSVTASTGVFTDGVALNFSAAIGGTGGVGGDGGSINLLKSDSTPHANAGVITEGLGASAIALYSIGGGGGAGGDVVTVGANAVSTYEIGSTNALGGKGGRGGHGGRVTAVSYTDLTTAGLGANALEAVSVGGGGGKGGMGVSAYLDLAGNTGGGFIVKNSLSIGGAGGEGGSGGAVTARNFPHMAITTKSGNATGLFAMSVGGGGGRGGDAIAAGAYVAATDGLAVTSDVGIGGAGGSGGDGGTVVVDNMGLIRTGISGVADYSFGVMAQSVGGGGGSGGMASTVNLDLVKYVLDTFAPEKWSKSFKDSENSSKGVPKSIRADIALGGAGGDGGDGNKVTVENTAGGSIQTFGSNSAAVFAQSVGGGGGLGMTTYTKQVVNPSLTGQVGLGGEGGSGGHGGLVVVMNKGSLTTHNSGSPAVFAQSVGGGGGVAGTKDVNAVNPKDLLSKIDDGNAWLKLAKGFYDKTTDFSGNTDLSAGKDGLKEYEGLLGNVDSKTGTPKAEKPKNYSFAFNLNHGGTGGSGGNGGEVRVRSSGKIQTDGDLSVGVFAQSVGGGGGDGGVGLVKGAGVTVNNEDVVKIGKSKTSLADLTKKAFENATTNLGVNVVMGGDGGTRGNGGAVNGIVTSSITTKGDRSAGVFLQSVGGGGGTGAAAVDDTTGLIRFGARIGGSGSNSGGDGGAVEITLGNKVDAASITTAGDLSPAVRLQSVGGGGGTTDLMTDDPYKHMENIRPQKDTATQVLTDMLATLDIPNDDSQQVVANQKNSKEIYDWMKFARDAYTKGEKDAMASVFGGLKDAFSKEGGLALATIGFDKPVDGAAAGHGGDLKANLTNANLLTSGQSSHGLAAWSVGGGGGLVTPLTKDSLFTLVHARARDGATGNGGAITVNLSDTVIKTTGEQSYGVVAQSIGGGGGYMGIADLLVTDSNTESIKTQGDGGHVSVTSAQNTRITTTGDRSHGLFMVSAGGNFRTVQYGDDLVVMTESTKGGLAGNITLDFVGDIQASGRGATGVLAVATGTAKYTEQSTIDLAFQKAAVQGGTGEKASAIGIITERSRYRVTLDAGSSVSANDGYAIATMNAGLFTKDSAGKPIAQAALWDTPTLSNGERVNEVVVSGKSTLSGDVLLTGASRLIVKDSSNWNPGTYSVVGGVDDLTRVWDQPVKFLRQVDNELQAANLDVKLNQPGQIALLTGSTLNPGGQNRFTTSTIHIGATDQTHGMLWLAGGSSLEMDIGHEGGALRHDQLLINPGSAQAGSLVSGGQREGGGYNLKVRLVGLRDVLNKDVPLVQASSRVMRGKLEQPLAVSGSTNVVTLPSGGEQLNYRLQSVTFDRTEMPGFSRTIAQQFDEHFEKNDFALEAGMVKALSFYPGQESDYQKQMHELAENGNVFDVSARRLKGLVTQNFMHSCQAFVGQGLGLVEQNCAYARVTGSDVSMSASGAAAAQDVSASQMVLGGQRRLGEGLFAGVLFGLGQSSANSTDGEYTSTNQSLSVGAVLKKRFAQKYEVALSGTYSMGWTDSNRWVMSSLATPTRLTGSHKNHEAGLRLRLAYYGTTDTVYIKPYVDFDARYYQSDAWTESGDSPFAMIFPSMSFWTYTATPMLEVGTRFKTDNGNWRAFVGGGVALSNDDKQTMEADFVATSGGAPIEMQWEATPTMGIARVGAEYVGKDNSFFTLTYEGMFGDGVRQHSLMARVGLRF